MIQPWREIRRREMVQTPIFRLTARESSHPQRPEAHEFYVLEAPEWVNVVPLTRDDQVVMVRQYRHGIQQNTLEIPGGMMDPGDATPLSAARRELLEETGYLGRSMWCVGSIAPNPAIQSNRCHSFVATDLMRQSASHPDESEDLEVELVDLARIPELIRTGAICHALVVVAFCFALGLGVPGKDGVRAP